MIVHISGTLTSKTPEMAVVEASGVGYGVWIPTLTYEKLPPTGQQVTLLTHLITREGIGQELFGFLTRAEKELFTIVISVSGVGPKIALGILSNMAPDRFRMAVMTGDIATITETPGVGKKTAERLVVELREKLGSVEAWEMAGVVEPRSASDPRSEAARGLVALGYSHHDAVRAVQIGLQNTDQEHPTTESLIRAALGAT